MADPRLTAAIGDAKYAAAIKLLDAWLTKEQGGPKYEALLLDRAACHRALGLTRKAHKDYDEILLSNPTSSQALTGKALVVRQLKRQQEAQDLLRSACQGYTAGSLSSIIHAREQLAVPEAPPASPLTQQVASSHAPPTQQAQAPAASSSALSHVAGSRRGAQPIPSDARPDQSMSAMVGMAITQINQGRLAEAVDMLDDAVQASSQPNFSAHLARGTARALQRKLKEAVEDFDVAIRLMPSYGDAWKRRAQAKNALEDLDGAAQDLQQALKLAAGAPDAAEVHLELGVVYRRQRNYRRSVQACRTATQLDPSSQQAWHNLGLGLLSLGDLDEAAGTFRKAHAMLPDDADVLFNLAHCLKEAGKVKEATATFTQAKAALPPGKSNIGAMRIQAHMLQCTGDHWGAVQVLNAALKACDCMPAEAAAQGRLSCRFLRGACYHALGYARKAVQDYQAVFMTPDAGLDSEARGLVCLGFYQKELAQHLHACLDRPQTSFCADREIDPVFKELWAKKAPPSQQLVGSYRPQPKIPSERQETPPRPDPEAEVKLAEAADALGALLLYRHQGFVSNRRQQRAGGLGAIELAQTLRALVGKGGSTQVTQGASGDPSPHAFGWRDAMDILVKWRQLSEPNDQVFWVDLLTEAEFKAGFGSHTPMYTGQTKCVRYYMNFARGLDLFRRVVLKKGKAHDADSREFGASAAMQARVRQASTAEEMHAAMGRDCWVVVPLHSMRQPGLVLEGSRLTLVKLTDQPDAYDFSIRTPVTPARWAVYDLELAHHWRALVQALMAEPRDLPRTAEAALTYVYYWYNFMPLARGTAVVGYITLLALFLAAGMPITVPAPPDYQLDWEAILCQDPADFVREVSRWLYPAAARPPATAADGAAADGVTAAAAAAGGPSSVLSGDKSAAAAAAASSRESMATVIHGRDTASSLEPDGQQQRGSNSADSGPESASAACAPAGAEPGLASKQPQRSGRKPTADAGRAGPGLEQLPDVASLIPTIRNRIEALNGQLLPRL